MNIQTYLPFWSKLTSAQQQTLEGAMHTKSVGAGTLLHGGSGDCTGLLLVTEGQLRVYTISDEGKEITLYRLLEGDMCLFSASCMLSSIQFDVFVQSELTTTVVHIPPEVYKALMQESLAVANYTNELMASRFSDVMWLMDQILNKKLDSRLAALLLEEASLAGSTTLRLTHDQLARHLGTAREVVTRMLKYFQSEHLVRLERGTIILCVPEQLKHIAADSLR